jgi:para-aminobenzoate synthetase component 1
MTIEKYSHVMHIVSNVRGELEEDKNAFDVIKAVFPGGTITGAPKIRTMEIIEQLEPIRRGAYTGSIGWIDYSGDMELNIVIRTLLAKDGQAYVQAGAGIVIDSNPKHEYQESLKKATALWRSKESSEEW